MSDVVKYEVQGRAAVITVNRPEKRNALNNQVRTDIKESFRRAAADGAVRAVILTGAGDKAFIAGADIGEFEGRTPIEQWREMSNDPVFDAPEKCPKPVIAAVNGFCLGGGMEIALACDIRIASNAAKFGQPEVNLGIIPGGGGTQRLPRVAGVAAALRLILTGEMVDAAEAHRVGIVSEVTEPAQLMPRALAIAEMIASKSPVAVASAKQATRAALSLPLDEGLRMERSLFALCFASEDKVEGVRAFLEKRTPEFPGK
jgi:enoyl-CoA hydratase